MKSPGGGDRKIRGAEDAGSLQGKRTGSGLFLWAPCCVDKRETSEPRRKPTSHAHAHASDTRTALTQAPAWPLCIAPPGGGSSKSGRGRPGAAVNHCCHAGRQERKGSGEEEEEPGDRTGRAGGVS